MSRPRRRNAVLETLELLRGCERSVNLTQVIAFLYICENEGLSISELALMLKTSRATASRVARSLTEPGYGLTLPPSWGLVEVFADEDPGSPSKGLHLTQAGRDLRSRIGDIIREAQPIEAPRVRDIA